jgi:hypothetical protein
MFVHESVSTGCRQKPKIYGGDRAPYISRLLLAESGAVCRACRAKEAERPREARALHVNTVFIKSLPTSQA